ncbi:hypothetical protein PIB30_064568 [Stylosanthes scabra]|uniref:Uncharacterized protein n=1 Tax=Stylosanthes scabra TaxID=79078 RepID=A0ABU6RLV3_9FABA|nr:hypothetical protein [Stylosanthes scabra]
MRRRFWKRKQEPVTEASPEDDSIVLESSVNNSVQPLEDGSSAGIQSDHREMITRGPRSITGDNRDFVATITHEAIILCLRDAAVDVIERDGRRSSLCRRRAPRRCREVPTPSKLS